MSERKIFHRCQCAGMELTFDEHAKYVLSHDTTAEALAEHKGFRYNYCDVCLNPNNPLSWSGGDCGVKVYTALTADGWSYGFEAYMYTFGHTSPVVWGVDNHFTSEQAACHAALSAVEQDCVQRVKEVQQIAQCGGSGDLCGHKLSKMINSLQAFSRKLSELKYGKQLTLFEL